MRTPGAALLCLFSTCGRPAAGDATGGMAAALEASPGIAPRLSVPTPFRRCVDRVPPDGTIPRAVCSAPRRNATSPLALAGIKPGADDPRSVHLLALLDLTADDPRGIALDRAISSLRRVVELSDDPTPALVDLSAALIVRAERAQAPRDLLEAYETAQKAADLQPHNPAALYNRALALDRFGLVEETADDWKTALAADSTTGWAAEARRRLRALQSIHPPVPPRDDAPLSDYARYAAEEPQGARELGMDKLLPAWGDATLRGDTARAADRLRRAEALGTALLRRPGGDASLADMVRAIRSTAADTAAMRKLAEAHREYGGGRGFYGELDYARARGELSSAHAASARSLSLHLWSGLYLGTTLSQLGRREEGSRTLRDAATADHGRYPSLVASARWMIGLMLAQADRWEPSLANLGASVQLFARAGEVQNQAGALGIVVDARFVLGEPDSGYSAVHQSLHALKNSRSSIRLHNLLIATAEAAAADGLTTCAARILGEDVAIATRIGSPEIVAEARLEHARILASSDHIDAAKAEVSAARGIVDEIAGRRNEDWFDADLNEATAAVLLHEDPARATRLMDSAASFFASVPLPLRVFPALVGSAIARVSAGDPQGAADRLENAIRLLEQRRDSIRIEPRRAAVFEAARGAVDRLVLLKLADGQTAEALDYMDRARAALAPAGSLAAESPGAAVRGLPGEVALSYARIADTLLVWVVAGETVRITRSVVDTIALARIAKAVSSNLERGAPEAEIRPLLARLHEWLVRPVSAFLGAPEHPLVIVADGEIASIPFAALLNPRDGRYLIEDHPIRFAVSLREARRISRFESGGGVLIVDDPAFNPREFPLLTPLQHTHAEVRSVRANYVDPLVLQGPRATREAITKAFERATIIHFAGHAVFDDDRPERSYLLVAPSRGLPTSSRLTAADVAQLDLRKARLVVLSACRTIGGRPTRSGGFTGVAGALLAGGAGGVVGSTWAVDDAATVPLMAEFHRAYRARMGGPRALRDAQLALIRSNQEALRNPAAWGGFRYFGR